ncbi:MAG: ABC transporter substrate-binding protein [Salinisphaera sp.]|jgi:phospholipid transport system substrate-binding protein|nr:ABC transporter substrate-binding protein [Salinisphaera sp.]
MKIVTRLIRGVIATAVVGASISVWTVAAAEPAQTVVENLDSALVNTMKQGQKLGFAGRYKELAPVIDQSFDLNRIARLALGTSWSKLDSKQQMQYKSMFRKDTLATYASRFDSYSGQSFKIKNVKDAPGGRRRVNTVIVSKGKEIPISYLLDNTGGTWKIVNVVAKGASDLALKRAQYTASIRDKGPDGFIQQFRIQLKKYPEIPNVPVGAATTASPTDPAA